MCWSKSIQILRHSPTGVKPSSPFSPRHPPLLCECSITQMSFGDWILRGTVTSYLSLDSISLLLPYPLSPPLPEHTSQQLAQTKGPASSEHLVNIIQDLNPPALSAWPKGEPHSGGAQRIVQRTRKKDMTPYLDCRRSKDTVNLCSGPV